ncbi:hypothetical protein DPEC_G00145630 [Dallia pectoralis]|uniref:Uncharacterized protein n=1 Tax=Dallia pectoralis TaxID=75939 RepID=A0ACC2GNX9_DALPE|nr:hypothetical protein DPEC_G00145630 [Dallia pectoralis]
MVVKKLMMSACELTGPGFGLSVALIVFLQSTTAQNYATLPGNISVAVGKTATLQCGVVNSSGQLNFTLYGSRGNTTLLCPGGTTEYLAGQSIKGYCSNAGNEYLAIWLISVTSILDDNTRVVCKTPGQPEVDGYLMVYADVSNFGTLIGCVIGGFFGILIVFGLAYVVVRRSERLQRCFRGNDSEDDDTTMVTKD